MVIANVALTTLFHQEIERTAECLTARLIKCLPQMENARTAQHTLNHIIMVSSAEPRFADWKMDLFKKTVPAREKLVNQDGTDGMQLMNTATSVQDTQDQTMLRIDALLTCVLPTS